MSCWEDHDNLIEFFIMMGMPILTFFFLRNKSLPLCLLKRKSENLRRGLELSFFFHFRNFKKHFRNSFENQVFDILSGR